LDLFDDERSRPHVLAEMSFLCYFSQDIGQFLQSTCATYTLEQI